MLTKEENERLTRVGPGTPCGELMRRYWHPIAPAAQLDENPVRKVRILCEDLILYRDRQGRLGLIGDRCAHRAMDLRFGIPEEEGLRCAYHGWRFDAEGRCVEQPLEPPDSTFKDRIRIKAYPVQELGGLVWAYLGPAPAPLLPEDDLFVREDGFRQIIGHRLPCNWLQVMENRADPSHTTYLHGRLGQYVAEREGRLNSDPAARYNVFMRRIEGMRRRGVYNRYRFIPTAYGFSKATLASDLSDEEGGPVWTHGGNPVLFPYQLVHMSPPAGNRHVIRRAYQIGVPIDDITTWHIYYLCYTFPPEVNAPEQASVSYAEVPLQDEQGEYSLDYVTGQDMVAWYAQGPIADRTEEHLGASDAMVIAYRKLLAEQIQVVEDGGGPINVFRDRAAAYRRELNLTCVQLQDMDIPRPEARSPFRRTGGWLDLNEDGDVGRYCPDKAILEELYRRTMELWEREEHGPPALSEVRT
jgi:5,5'-dehydrodivanillate O-demethylase